MVLSNDIDIIYQIRWLLQHTSLPIKVVYAQAVNPSADAPPLPIEKILHEMTFHANNYYCSKNFMARPNKYPISYPAQQLCITYNKHPITSELSTFLHETERKLIREEYFEHRFGIAPTTLLAVDTYTLGRVIKKTLIDIVCTQK